MIGNARHLFFAIDLYVTWRRYLDLRQINIEGLGPKHLSLLREGWVRSCMYLGSAQAEGILRGIQDGKKGRIIETKV